MRDEFARWASDYPPALQEDFVESPVARYVTQALPQALQAAVPQLREGYKVEGSAGQGRWTQTPWIAVLDPAVTDTVQEGFYLVYVLAPNGARLYLSLMQGCTVLKDELGIAAARAELARRTELMRSRVHSASGRFNANRLDLQSKLWRAQLYTAGSVLCVEYDTTDLPEEHSLRADLSEGLEIYRALRNAGGWTADDEMIREAQEDGVAGKLEEAKRYRLHRSIERRSGNADKVKKAQGTTCKGCDTQLSDFYGAIAIGLIHAHHLRPLATLASNEKVSLDPLKDFAVLCPNCHSVIHRLEDVSDLGALRALIAEVRTTRRYPSEP